MNESRVQQLMDDLRALGNYLKCKCNVAFSFGKAHTKLAASLAPCASVDLGKDHKALQEINYTPASIAWYLLL